MSAKAVCKSRFPAGFRRPYVTTTMAATAVKMDNRMDFAGVLTDENIPKATPVFRTYVMLKNPSITIADSLRSNRFWINDLVHRSSTTTAATKNRYGDRPLSLDVISAGLYPAGSPGCHAVWYSQNAFFHFEVRKTGYESQRK